MCRSERLTAALVETPVLPTAREAWGALLYAGFLSVGIGYTLQVVAQREAHPTHAAILFSLEAVFAALGAGGCWTRRSRRASFLAVADAGRHAALATSSLHTPSARFPFMKGLIKARNVRYLGEMSFNVWGLPCVPAILAGCPGWRKWRPIGSSTGKRKSRRTVGVGRRRVRRRRMRPVHLPSAIPVVTSISGHSVCSAALGSESAATACVLLSAG